jgi:adenine-specific DNA methylase
MTAPYRKKLIEVALPLKAINEASAREKSIRHGHPSTLHLWWARRPLAACRAVLFASLVDDPDSDPAYGKADGTVDEDRAGAFPRANPKTPQDVLATIYRHLGVDTEKQYINAAGRPISVLPSGTPISELC